MTRRILLVSPYSFDSHGGVQTQVDGIATALAHRGEEVAVLAPGRGEERELNGYRFIPASRSISVPSNGSRAPVAPTPAAFAATRRTLEAFSPTVLHLHEPLAPGPGLFALWEFEGPIVGTFHRSRSGWVYPIYGRLNARIARRITVDVVVSAAAEATAITALGRAFRWPVVVPNGVDCAALAAEITVRNRRPVALFVGRHEPRKGLGVLLEAFTAIEGDVELQVVGDGPETERLARRYDDGRIVWVGAVGDEEKRRRVAAADLFVAPSLGGESFGVVIIEALAGGCAVIASDLPGYREAGGSVPMFVPPGDPIALRRAMEALFDDPGEVARLADEGREVAERFDFVHVAEEYLAIYDRAVSEYSPVRRGRRTHRKVAT
jgi:phosphatidylinositol alpha-mannosyltransferase